MLTTQLFMNLRKLTAKSSIILSAAEAICFVSSFVRNVILARLLSKEDFGVAATFGLVLTMVECSSKLGISKIIVQDKEGDRVGFVGTAHSLQLLCGCISAGVVVVCSPLLCRLFEGSDISAGMVSALSLAFLFQGLWHLDCKRFERQLNCWPSAMIEVASQVILTLVTWPLVSWIPDFRSVLMLIVSKSLITLVGSHCVAERTYSCEFERESAKRMLMVGWPLVANALLMLAITQGEQWVIGTFYSMSELGLFAAAYAIVGAPTFAFAKVFATLSLPILSKAEDNAELLLHRYGQVVASLACFATVTTLLFVLGGEAFMVIAYGHKYVEGGLICSMLAIVNGFKILRMGSAAVALAKGDSKNQMYSNMWRVSSIVFAIGLGVSRAPMWMVALSGVVGEIAACWSTWYRLWRVDGIAMFSSIRPALMYVVSVSIGLLTYLVLFPRLGVWGMIPVTVVGGCAGAVVMICIQPAIKHECVRFRGLLREKGLKRCMQELYSR